ncbi:MAG: PH domain-containing protein [Candidatus Thermoplasmatota archaeon]
MARTSAKPSSSFTFPTRPESGIRWVWSIRGALFPLLYLAPLSFPLLMGLLFANGRSNPFEGAPAWIFFIPLGIYLLIALTSIIYANAAASRYSFEVQDEEVIVRKGVFFTTTTRIPLRRVQDVHVRQGPLLRAFGLASIKLDTAGGFNVTRGPMGFTSEGQMPGVRDAEIVAERLMERVKRLKGDV